MAPKLLLFVPAAAFDARHVEMNRVQSLLKGRLAGRLPDVTLTSAVVWDHVAAELIDPMREACAGFDVYVESVPARYGTQWGIRKPTNLAIEELAADHTHLLRVIQDTFVTDPARFAQDVAAALDCIGSWVAAAIHHWPTDGHRWLCDRMGLRFDRDLRYPNGAVMLAPVPVWRRFYLGLPEEIHHFWDDIMMGEWLLQSGGAVVNWRASWEHRHDCPADECRALYERHATELGAAEALTG